MCLGAFSVPQYQTNLFDTRGRRFQHFIFFYFYTEKLCTSAPRDAEGVKGQTNIPFCIEFQELSNGDVSFTVAIHCVTVGPSQNFPENLKFSIFYLLLILTNSATGITKNASKLRESFSIALKFNMPIFNFYYSK